MGPLASSYAASSTPPTTAATNKANSIRATTSGDLNASEEVTNSLAHSKSQQASGAGLLVYHHHNHHHRHDNQNQQQKQLEGETNECYILQEQQEVAEQHHYQAPLSYYHFRQICGQRQTCECPNQTGGDSKALPVEPAGSFDLDSIDRYQHHSLQSHCSTPSSSISAIKQDYNDDSHTDHLLERHHNQFNFHVQQQSSSQSERELEISRGDNMLQANQLRGYSRYTETGECWVPSCKVPRTVAASATSTTNSNQFSEPTFSHSHSTEGRGRQAYGFSVYSNFHKSGLEDAKDFNNNSHSQQQNSVFQSGAVMTTSRATVDQGSNVYHYHSTSSQEQVYTTQSYYSVPACSQTPDYSNHAQPFHQDRSFTATCGGQQQVRTSVSSSPERRQDNEQQPQQRRMINNGSFETNSRSFQQPQQHQNCSNYGQVMQHQQSVSHQDHVNTNQINHAQGDNQQFYSTHGQSSTSTSHQLYHSTQEQQTISDSNQVVNVEQYSAKDHYMSLQQLTKNCDNNYANQVSITSAVSVSSQIVHTSDVKLRSLKGRRGRPRKSPRSKNKVNGKLWEFIRDLLLNDRTNPSFIRWEQREDGVFKFVQSDKVAKMWGERKQNPKMTYEKLSRAMRYYYKSKVLLPVFGRRLVYKFGPNATGWMPETGNNAF